MEKAARVLLDQLGQSIGVNPEEVVTKEVIDDIIWASVCKYSSLGSDLGWVYLTHWGREKKHRHFAADILKRTFLNENKWISIKNH